MKKRLAGITLILFIALPIFAYAGLPLETVQKNVNRVLDVLRDPALQGDSKKEVKEEKIRSISNDLFNWNELSKRTLGRNWRKLNADQRKEFIQLFRDILEAAYMDRILAYKDEKVEFNKEKMLTKKKAEVQTTIITKSANVPINYRVILKDNRWGVYDVVIEGISLVKNYRTQFRDILSKKSPEGLLETLRKKVRKA